MASKATIFLMFRRLSMPVRTCLIPAAACLRAPSENYQRSSNSQVPESLICALKNDLCPGRLIFVLDLLSDINSSVRVFRWASNQRSFQHTTETYAYMVLKLGMLGKHKDMGGFLKEMLKSLESLNMEETLNYMVNSFCRNQRSREALLVFEHACLASRRISVSACNGLLHALITEKGNLHHVLFVYKEMVKAGIPPDVETLNSLLQALCEGGWMDIVLDQFHRMRNKRWDPNSRTFEIMISGLCTSDRGDEAIKILSQMFEMKCNRSHDFYNNIIPLFCKIGKSGEAMKLFTMMKDDGFSPGLYLYDVLIQFLCENRKLDDAVELFDEMFEWGVAPTTCMYEDIVDGYCKLGKLSDAINFLRENSVSEIEPYNVLIKGCCNMSRFHEATSLLGNLAGRVLCNNLSWNIIIRALCEIGEVGKAFEVLGKMIVSSYVPDQATYSAIVVGYCRMHAYHIALEKFRIIHVSNMFMDSHASSELIVGLCHANKIIEAVDVFSYVASKGCTLTTDSISMLTEGVCLTGNVDEAIRLQKLAYCSGLCSIPGTYVTIMLKLLECKKEDSVLALFSQLLVQGCTLDVATYCILIYCFCAENAAREAALLFSQMVEDGFFPDSQALEMLLSSLARNSMFHMVIYYLDKVVNKEGLFSPAICNMTICGLLKEGYKDEACKYLDWMLEKGWVPDADTHALLVGSINLDERDVMIKTYDCDDHDKVSNILAEGLESCSWHGG